MKILITAASFLILGVSSFAQNSLSNTKWKGIMLIPAATDVVLNFKKDSLFLFDGKKLLLNFAGEKILPVN